MGEIIKETAEMTKERDSLGCAKLVVAHYGVACVAFHTENCHSFITPFAVDLLRSRTAILRV